MRNTTKRTYIILFLIGAFFIGLGIMIYTFVTNGDSWVAHRANSHIYSNGELTVAGTIYDRDGKILVSTQNGKRVFNDDSSVRKATLHVVGDSGGYIATGVQNLYRSNLVGYNFVDGIYNTLTDAEGCDIKLTIDADVSKAAYQALNGRKGTVTVYNYKTGETICMVSAPTYDPKYKPSNDELNSSKYEGVYLNRALSGVFTPGSTFKIVTTIAAIENLPDLYSKKFKCNGKYETGAGEVICNGVHGTVNLERGLNVSCNCVFAQLANEVGKDVMTQTMRDLGFTKKVTVSKATTVRSSFDVSKSTKLDLGWAGIGQYTTLINPCQMLMLMGAIANDGIAMTPYVVEESSEIMDVKNKQNTAVKLSAETANKVKKLMRSNVKNYYGDSRLPNLEMCGKTGTAEVKGEKSHAWFVGFSQKADLPYAIVVCIQNGGWGFNEAVPVANKTMQAVLSNVK
ncbi:MAG: penicillin-binding transpeptidase domain-containing protein [Acutalibacteraceae bacterium]|nr:penicillin-binding transpeptidase domain-containing protein [Acutalibacteraceae bacterium]